MKSKQHTQLPNEMSQNDLSPKDQLIYLGIRSFMNKDTKSCYPSLQAIAEKVGSSIPTVRKSIETLKKKDYLKTKKRGKGQEYIFNELKEFEPFSPEFLDIKDISFTTKSYLVASQQYMFKDVEGVGKISYSNEELSNKINMSETSIRRCNQELERKDYLAIIKNEGRNIETGYRSDTKIFNLQKLGQAIIWTLKNHEERLTEHDNKFNEYDKKFEEQNKLITAMAKEINRLKGKEDIEIIL